jgi:hypothetical protein
VSKNKRPSPATDLYLSHLGQGRTFYNPSVSRTGVLERMYTRVLTELSANRFEWKNVPDTINVRYLELTLFYKAMAVWYNDKNFGQLALSAAPDMMLNHYGDPLAFQVFGANNYINKRISAKECVPIYANMLRQPDLDIVRIYATKLAEMDRTVEINSINARRNKVMTIGENQLLSAENIERQLQEGQAVIKVAQTFDVGAVLQAIDLAIDPKGITEVHVLRTRLFNECMGLMGINNANQDKKERLVESEVSANDDQIAATRRVNLNQRQEAADKINKMFKENIEVDFYKPPIQPVGGMEGEQDSDTNPKPKEVEK